MIITSGFVLSVNACSNVVLDEGYQKYTDMRQQTFTSNIFYGFDWLIIFALLLEMYDIQLAYGFYLK